MVPEGPTASGVWPGGTGVWAGLDSLVSVRPLLAARAAPCMSKIAEHSEQSAAVRSAVGLAAAEAATASSVPQEEHFRASGMNRSDDVGANAQWTQASRKKQAEILID